MDDKKLGMIRHALTTIGGILIATGVATEGDVSSIVSGVVALVGVASTIIGFVASWRSKKPTA